MFRGNHGAWYSLLRNIWANNRARVPRSGSHLSVAIDPDGLLMDFRINVIFIGLGVNNNEDRATRFNFINNYFTTNYFTTDWRLIERSPYARTYIGGNFHVNPDKRNSQWKMIDTGEKVNREYHDQPEPFNVDMLTTLSSEKAWKRVHEPGGLYQ